MEMKCDGTHTHLVTLICTLQDCVGGIFLCRYTVTNKENKMENKHLILFDHFKRHIYTAIFFQKFYMVLGLHMGICVIEPNLLKKSQNLS